MEGLVEKVPVGGVAGLGPSPDLEQQRHLPVLLFLDPENTDKQLTRRAGCPAAASGPDHPLFLTGLPLSEHRTQILRSLRPKRTLLLDFPAA